MWSDERRLPGFRFGSISVRSVRPGGLRQLIFPTDMVAHLNLLCHRLSPRCISARSVQSPLWGASCPTPRGARGLPKVSPQEPRKGKLAISSTYVSDMWAMM